MDQAGRALNRSIWCFQWWKSEIVLRTSISEFARVSRLIKKHNTAIYVWKIDDDNESLGSS